jgi:hypothetical protein
VRADRILLAVLIVAALAACAVIMTGAKPVDSEAAALAARRWADGLGLRITGVVCERGRCTVAPVSGRPFVVYCGPSACSMPEGQASQ